MGIVAEYSKSVAKGLSEALEFVEVNKKELSECYPNSLAEFILNIKTRYVMDYENRDEISDEILLVTEKEEFYTSDSAIVSNFLIGCNGSTVKYQKVFEEFLIKFPTRFSLLYFLEIKNGKDNRELIGNEIDFENYLKRVLVFSNRSRGGDIGVELSESQLIEMYFERTEPNSNLHKISIDFNN